MVEIIDKRKCTGCGACANICPVAAIQIQYDSEGFLYPVIDKETCIQCDKCEQVCHMLNSNEIVSNMEPDFFAAALKEENMLMEVSSGGVFWALVRLCIEKKGVVYGVKQYDSLNVRHDRGTTLKECESFRRSKYVESEIGDSYLKARTDLDHGREVLFSGTGCQIAGLRKYLQKEYINLTCCEIVCHGVPSKRVYMDYIKKIEKEKNSRVSSVIFRDKEKGWNKNQIYIQFENGSFIRESSQTNLFHGGYLRGLYYRPSCGMCQYAKIPRIGDIILADYWAYSGRLKEINNNKGISLVIVSTNKGKEIFKDSEKYLNIDKTSRTEATKSCRHLEHTPKEHKNRAKFFGLLDTKGYDYAVEKLSRPTQLEIFKSYLYQHIITVKSYWKGRRDEK